MTSLTTHSPNPTLSDISYRLQNAATEADRMCAWSELQDYLLTYPLDAEAQFLIDKYQKLDRDWTSEVKSW